MAPDFTERVKLDFTERMAPDFTERVKLDFYRKGNTIRLYRKGET